MCFDALLGWHFCFIRRYVAISEMGIELEIRLERLSADIVITTCGSRNIYIFHSTSSFRLKYVFILFSSASTGRPATCIVLCNLCKFVHFQFNLLRFYWVAESVSCSHSMYEFQMWAKALAKTKNILTKCAHTHTGAHRGRQIMCRRIEKHNRIVARGPDTGTHTQNDIPAKCDFVRHQQRTKLISAFHCRFIVSKSLDLGLTHDRCFV